MVKSRDGVTPSGRWLRAVEADERPPADAELDDLEPLMGGDDPWTPLLHEPAVE